MARTQKIKPAGKQKRQSQRIAQSLDKPNPSDQAEKLRLWSLKNAMAHGEQKSGSGKRHLTKKVPAGKKGAKPRGASALRPYAPRAAAASRKAGMLNPEAVT